MKSESTDGSTSERPCVCAPHFEGFVLQCYFFTLVLPNFTKNVSIATYGLVSRSPIGLLACFALEQEKIIDQP